MARAHDDYDARSVVLKDNGSPLHEHNSLWLHGGGLTGDTWTHLTADLDRAVTPDLPGHGSTPVVSPATVEGYALLLSDSLPPNAVLIGHSFGGMVALEIAANRESRISALVLIEAVPTLRDRLSGRLSATVFSSVFRLLPSRWLAWLAGVGQTSATRAELRRQLPRLRRGGMAAMLNASMHYDGRRHLPGMSVPTLIVVGSKSPATHHGAKLMADQIPGAELLTLPGGHMLHTDNPVQLRRAIDDFLSRRL